MRGVFVLFLAISLPMTCSRIISGETAGDLTASLLHSQLLINSSTPFCYSGHSSTRQAYLSKKWSFSFSKSSSHQTLVYPFCLTTQELGNKLGNYFTEVGCAEVSGLHFVAVHKQWDLVNAFHTIASAAVVGENNSSDKRYNNITYSVASKAYPSLSDPRLSFLNGLPDIIVHANPAPDENTAISNVHRECKCTRYCWQDRGAPWVKIIPSIRTYMRAAISLYLDSLPKDATTTVSPDTDFSNGVPGARLPLIPDVALQYRCGDNIGFSYMYGILPFTAFLSRIPKEGTSFIYVLSDHPTRASHSPYSSRCQVILEHLFNFLKTHYPKSTVVVKRGGDLFLDYARLAFAKVTICSASSYCLWPSLANTGTVYFPISSLVAGADSMALAPNLSSNFHWIDVDIISDFRKFRPWTQVLEILEGKNV